jgi:hypothetical protein
VAVARVINSSENDLSYLRQLQIFFSPI